ncbi:MAG: hypothetical protein ABI416_11960, partial [Ginsengibacter sp.]
FTLCTMGLSEATSAGVKSDNPIEFKFIGKLKNRPVFQLNLNNAEAEEFLISIKDENHDLLYTEKVKAQKVNFSRNYGLDIEDGDLNTPGFSVIVEVTSKKTNVTQVYKISSHRSVTENIVVAQL